MFFSKVTDLNRVTTETKPSTEMEGIQDVIGQKIIPPLQPKQIGVKRCLRVRIKAYDNTIILIVGISNILIFLYFDICRDMEPQRSGVGGYPGAHY